MERERSRSRRSEAHKKFYDTKRWKLCARDYRFRHPLCEHDGCEELAVDVHHKVDIAAGGEPYHAANLMALCKPHHSQITRQRL
jgi:5-methylcytosine-specific restriction enzyme A